MDQLLGEWASSVHDMKGYSYTCGHCGNNAGPSIGYKCYSGINTSKRTLKAYI
ncbi:hypothetical protein JCM21714_1966 [Gracilibacillus boraciitolerans JCM 21714]|uniref:Uncharacterized protein n=1 Tax=Gracilibacillus boraciitolerans JCM 21714 TaxID=1298598 RepID=W4VHT6_9BACI|nr:hypothetical protein [Gracilibacillus boraciitolerans]GAE92940.1 hypothetical protein JCM21714_1966 [Gracilibacillus boraciitolerans JCM 21714]